MKTIPYIEWKPIETAPRDGTRILLYWPNYAYNWNEDGEPLLTIGWWKQNGRLSPTMYPEHADHFIEHRQSEWYFADNDEMDDYGLSVPEHAPTHWMPLPPPPEPPNGNV